MTIETTLLGSVPYFIEAGEIVGIIEPELKSEALKYGFEIVATRPKDRVYVLMLLR